MDRGPANYWFVNTLRDQIQSEEGLEQLLSLLGFDNDQLIVPPEVLATFIRIRSLPRFMVGQGGRQPVLEEHFIHFPRYRIVDPLGRLSLSILKLLLLMYFANLVMFGRRVSMRWLYYVFRDVFGFRPPPQALMAVPQEVIPGDSYYDKFIEMVNAAIMAVGQRFDTDNVNIHRENAQDGIFGHLAFNFKGKSVEWDPENMHTNQGFPNFFREYKNVTSNADFILFVESGAAFSRLLEEEFPEKIRAIGLELILVTSHGFPSASFQKNLHFLAKNLQIPTFYLCDGDFYGIKIANTFMLGTPYAEPLPFGKTIIGLKPQDFNKIPADSIVSIGEKELAVIRGRIKYLTKEGKKSVPEGEEFVPTAELIDLKLIECIGKKASLSAFNFVDYRNETLSNFLTLKIKDLIQSGDIIKKEELQIKTEEEYEVIATIDIGEQPTEVEISNEAPMEVDDEEVKVLSDGTKNKRRALVKKGKFICNFCSTGFLSQRSLNNHLNVAHNKSTSKFKCHHCNGQFKYNDGLKQHLRKQHDEVLVKRQYQCTLCTASFPKGVLTRHLNMDHPESILKFKCHICNVKFKNRWNLSYHLKLHETSEYENEGSQMDPIEMGHDRERFRCTLCMASFSRKETLDMHLKNEHSMKKYKCPHCNRTFSSKINLGRHIMQHGDLKELKRCTLCPLEFTSKTTLTKHIRKVHPDFRFKSEHHCVQCNKTFSTQYKLREHIMKHGAEKELLRCTLCPLKFIAKAQLTKHIHKEHPDFRFESEHHCVQCNKTFSTQYHLRRHIFKHGVGKELLRCTLCPLKFLAKAQLTKHIHKEHPDFQFEFQCAQCKTGFMSRRSLRFHMEKHEV